MLDIILIIALAETLLFAYRTHKKMKIYRSCYYNCLMALELYDAPLKEYLESKGVKK